MIPTHQTLNITSTPFITKTLYFISALTRPKKIHSPSSPKHVIYLSVQIILYIHRNILSLSCAQNSPSTTPKNILVLYRSLYIKPLSTLYIHIVGVNSSMLFFFKNPPKNKTPKYIYHHSYVLAHLVHVKKLGAISPIVS